MSFSPRNFKHIAAAVLAVLAAMSSGIAQERFARPYVDLSFRGGSRAETGEGILFVPLRQNAYQMLFADVRGQIFDGGAEGNWGLAYRQILESGWIAGIYGFYDRRKTDLNNRFQQGSIGAELLNEIWGARINGYFPDHRERHACHLSRAYLSGNRIVVQPGLETAYWGVDVELERLLHGGRDTFNSEVWGAIGGYHFDDSSAGFENISGPRVRLEWRLYYLPLLGTESRLVIGGQFQYDHVRGPQGTGFASLRIPFGPGGNTTRPLDPIERRMVNPIVRDVDIVTNTGLGPPEPALFPDGTDIGPVTVVDATTPDVGSTVFAAGPGSVVVFDGSKGTIDLSAQGGTPVLVDTNQFVGGQFDVIGASSGCLASFGARPTVADPTNSIDIFVISDGSTVQGIDIVGGLNGILGFDLTGVTIRDNTISGARGAFPEGNGVLLFGPTSATIMDNVARDNEGDGFFVESFLSGTFSGNTASENGAGGFTLLAMSGGTMTGNMSHDNGADGFAVDVITGGTVAGNAASGNMGDGFDFDTLSGGIVSGNSATGNDESGFDITDFTSGTLSGNSATSNIGDGFEIGTLDGGTATGNVAQENVDGFNLMLLASGSLSANVAEDNADDGFDVDDITGGSATDNVARGNGDGFDFDSISAGLVSRNTADRNRDDGFDFDSVDGGMLTSNTSSGNADVGFVITFNGGNSALFEGNSAVMNAVGYEITGTPFSTGTGNTGSGNGGNDFFP